mmetsp:Transcript_65475/g.188356  ORF Transcript_65475/g.188356 Transcript_65475/m.188356 type:complete len:306 (-) Transcript_65475:1049-1966(-)
MLKAVLLLAVEAFQLVELIEHDPTPEKLLQDRKLQVLPAADVVVALSAAPRPTHARHEPPRLEGQVHEQGAVPGELPAAVLVDRGEEQSVGADHDIGLGKLLRLDLRQRRHIAHGEDPERAALWRPAFLHAAAQILAGPEELSDLLQPLLEEVGRHDDQSSLRRDEVAPVAQRQLGRGSAQGGVDQGDGRGSFAIADLVRQDTATNLVASAHSQVYDDPGPRKSPIVTSVGKFQLGALAFPAGVHREAHSHRILHAHLEDDSDHAWCDATPAEGWRLHTGGHAHPAANRQLPVAGELQVLHQAGE